MAQIETMPHLPNLFHQNGIDGLVLHEHFVDQLNDRLSTSQTQAERVSQAFEAFTRRQLAVAGQRSAGLGQPDWVSLLDALQQQVAHALSVREITTYQESPSEAECESSRPWHTSP